MLQAFLTGGPAGTSTENILVLETFGRTEGFRAAAVAVPGLEWLAEIDIDDAEADARFYEKPKIGKRFFKDNVVGLDMANSRIIVSAFKEKGIINEDGILQEDVAPGSIRDAIPQEYAVFADEIVKVIEEKKSVPLPGRMYLSLSNRSALAEIKTLFDNWERDGRLRYGAGVWSDIFSHLKAIRFWNVEDRVRDTGILDYWKKEFELKRGTASTVSFEVEFSYDDNVRSRQQRQHHVEGLVHAEGGKVIASCDMQEIHFHAIKVEVPVSGIERVLGGNYSALYRDGGIFFFRPSPQCAVESLADGTIDDIPSVQAPNNAPVVAVLDGVPFSHHNLIDGFIILDDPDDFEASYQPRELNHGTAMLSLICHGELGVVSSPISRKVYVRPILKPDEESALAKRPERIPKNLFFEDLVERSVRKMFTGEGSESPSAPTVKIINLSVADPDRMFHHFPGPTARLLDWLSYKYKVLFCISAGNIRDSINLKLDTVEFSELSDSEKISSVLSALHREHRNRRILAPSESINSITVGALHYDESTPVIIEGCVDILPVDYLPSPLSPIGHGFRSAIKPEIIVPGGRQLFSHIREGEYCLPGIAMGSGQKVATAPVMPGEKNRTIYTCGTSNATALTTRAACFIYDAIQGILGVNGIANADPSLAALIKALIVHGASWGEAAEVIENSILHGLHATEVKKGIARYLGYGRPDFRKSLECTTTRATAIGFGTISKNQRHEFRFPLPPSLSGLNCWRRLTITLAWLSPISTYNRKYRKAALTFEAKDMDKAIGGKRAEAQWQQVLNGTLQHEIIEGKRVVAFQENDHILIPVQCREDAGVLDEDVPYGLAISLEVKEEIAIQIYEEVKNMIEIAIREQVRVN
jgi:hypothetical protein